MSQSGDTSCNSSELLRVDGLRVAVRGADGASHVIVRDVSLTVAAGESLAIIGESGCGKTTLALTIARLLPESMFVEAGTVHLDGRPLLDANEAELQAIRVRSVGVVFQDSIGALNPLRSVGSVLKEVARRGMRSKVAAVGRVRECLDAVGLPERVLAMYPYELSGGMRQRVAIAIAIANEPRLLVADEPTTALDSTVQAQVLDVLRALKTQMSLVMITHDMAVASYIADTTVVMYAGRVLEIGEAERVLGSPAHPYTEALIAARPRIGGRSNTVLPTIPGMPPDLHADPTAGCVFMERCQRARPLCTERPDLVGDDAQRVACWYPVSRDLATAVETGGS